MFTKNIKDSFTANLLSAVSGVLGEAKKCKDCGCAKCECDDAEETKEGYMPTNDMPSAKDRATAGKLGALLKRERDAKEKKEPNGVKTEETEVEENYVSHAQRKAVWANRADDGKGHPDKKKKMKEESEELDEKRGLWDNIHAKRARIKAGSGERMRKPGSEGAPSAADLKASQTEAMDPGLEDELMSQRQGESGKKWRVERHGKTISTHSSKDEADAKAMKHPSNKVVAKESIDASFEEIHEISKPTLGRYINKAKNSIDLTAWRQGYKEAGAGNPSKHLEKKLSKRHKGIETAVNKLTKEDAEQIDEISKATLGSYIKKASGAEQPKNVMSPKNVPLTKIAAYQGDSETGHFGKRFNQATYDKAERLRKNRETGIKTAVNKLTKEESEQIDELSKDTMGRYINKAATKMGSQGVTAGLKIAADEKSSKNFKDMGKREKGIKLAVSKLTKEESNYLEKDLKKRKVNNDKAIKDMKKMGSPMRNPHFGEDVELDEGSYKDNPRHMGTIGPITTDAERRERAKKYREKLTKEEQDFIDALNDADIEQIDELSKDAMLKYLHANKHKNTKDGNPRRDLVKSMRGTDMAVRKYTAKPGSKSVRVPATEEVELDEARGRPKKAGAKDFTIHPKTKEKLMHNNPADMKRIERLQKNGILQKPKTEANQHIIQQLQRAKLSMRGGETVNFTHGDPTHVSGTHASKLLDKYAGMKPDEKESFQKKIGHSHANLKSEL